MFRPRVLLCAASCLLLGLTGCEATGIGWIPSRLVPGDKATFGFDVVTDPTTYDSSFSGSYQDPQGMMSNGKVVSVDFKGTGMLHKAPPPPGAPPVKGGCLQGAPNYQSTNPAMPGSGQLTLSICDLDGNGAGAGDYILLQVLDGPYALYQNFGEAHGNITVKQ